MRNKEPRVDKGLIDQRSITDERSIRDQESTGIIDLVRHPKAIQFIQILKEVA